MTQSVKISRIWDETPEIRCFELVPEAGVVANFDAGAHIEVHLPGNLIRQYSLWNSPGERDAYLIGVKKEPDSRGGSVAMHALAEGNTLQIGEPRNNFELQPEGKVIFLAGGIGITPVLAMARKMKEEGREAVLHLFTRNVENTPFISELADLPTAPIHLGLAPPVLDNVLSGLLANPADDTHLYFCGPGPFMDLVERLALSLGWPSARIHLERFSVDPDDIDMSGDEFEVVLSQSGQTITVREGQTIIEAMEAVGIPPLTSCEQGVCGTCMTNVLDGEPDHRDQYLNEAEKEANNVIMPCVSRCKGKRLVLDL